MTNAPNRGDKRVIIDTVKSPADPTALLFAPSGDDLHNLAQALQNLQMRVVVANSHEAMTSARHTGIVLILVDLDRDPHWKTTLQQLHTAIPNARLLAYSRHSEERLWLDALDAGAFDFVCKPFHERELRWILQSALYAGASRLPGAIAGQ
jgi:DNA-binding NtrC family response regulator